MIGANRLAKFDPNRLAKRCAERKVLPSILDRPVKLNDARQYRESRKMAAKIKQRFRNDQLQLRLLFRSRDVDDFGILDFRCCKSLPTPRSYRLLQQRHHITHAPFAKSIHRHEIDESPAPRQYREIFGR